MPSTKFRNRSRKSKWSRPTSIQPKTIFRLRLEATRHRGVARLRKYEKIEERPRLRGNAKQVRRVSFRLVLRFWRIIDDRAGAANRRKTSSTPHRAVRWIV